MIKDCKKHYEEMFRVRMMEDPCPFCEIDRLKEELAHYKAGVEVEGMYYHNKSSIYDDNSQMRFTGYIKGVKDGQRVKVLVMKEVE